jgi:hypothetical protein
MPEEKKSIRIGRKERRALKREAEALAGVRLNAGLNLTNGESRQMPTPQGEPQSSPPPVSTNEEAQLTPILRIEPPSSPKRGSTEEGSETLGYWDQRRRRKSEKKLRNDLQKALKRPVILIADGKFDPFKRKVVEYSGPILAVGLVGVGITSVVVTGGLAAPFHVVAASFPLANFPTLLAPKMLDPRHVILEDGAIDELLKMAPEKQIQKVQAAIGRSTRIGSDGSVTLSAKDITQASAERAVLRLPSTSTGVLLGFTVITGGLLLLALTLISQDIHGLMIKAASAILVVGALIVGAAMVSGKWPNGVSLSGTATEEI